MVKFLLRTIFLATFTFLFSMWIMMICLSSFKEDPKTNILEVKADESSNEQSDSNEDMLGVVEEVKNDRKRSSRKRRYILSQDSNEQDPNGVPEVNKSIQTAEVSTNSSCVESMALTREKMFINNVRNNNQLTVIDCPLLNMDSNMEETCLKMSTTYQRIFQDHSVHKRLQLYCTDYFKLMPQLPSKHLENLRYLMPVSFAYSIMTHGQIGILEALLASIFLPKNAYCIHVDNKADPVFKDGVRRLISCYKELYPSTTIILVERPVNVFWTDFSLLKADLLCLEQLHLANEEWEWFINQPGTSMPLLNVFEMERRIWDSLPYTSLGNSLISKPFPEKYISRIRFKHISPKANPNLREENPEMYHQVPKKTLVRKPPPPHNLKVYKGFKEVILYRGFTEWVMSDKKAKDFLDWCTDVASPEEIFFHTMVRVFYASVMNSESGQDLSSPSSFYQNDLCIRRSLWEENVHHCHGQMKRYICNLAIEDYPEALLPDEEGGGDKCLFINKFDLSVGGSSQALACLFHHLISSSARFLMTDKNAQSKTDKDSLRVAVKDMLDALKHLYDIDSVNPVEYPDEIPQVPPNTKTSTESL